jgi:hypothetical protein
VSQTFLYVQPSNNYTEQSVSRRSKFVVSFKLTAFIDGLFLTSGHSVTDIDGFLSNLRPGLLPRSLDPLLLEVMR